jgi:hypothetical protein
MIYASGPSLVARGGYMGSDLFTLIHLHVASKTHPAQSQVNELCTLVSCDVLTVASRQPAGTSHTMSAHRYDELCTLVSCDVLTVASRQPAGTRGIMSAHRYATDVAGASSRKPPASTATHASTMARSLKRSVANSMRNACDAMPQNEGPRGGYDACRETPTKERVGCRVSSCELLSS